MSDADNKENSANRSIAEFSVRYTSGVHTTGRKKGQEKIEEDIVTIIVPYADSYQVQDYIRAYCNKMNMSLINWDIQPLPGRRIGEFNCKNCGELTIDLNPLNNQFCSNYCRKKKIFF